jgi:hypothetical protein
VIARKFLDDGRGSSQCARRVENDAPRVLADDNRLAGDRCASSFIAAACCCSREGSERIITNVNKE